MLKSSTLKFSKNNIITFLIFVIVNSYAQAQNLDLKVTGATENQTKVIDSLGYKTTFKDLASLQAEILFIQKSLQKIGYIENQLISNTTKAANLFEVKFDLKTKFYTIYIYYNNEIVKKPFLSTFIEKVYEDYFEIPISEIESTLTIINNEIASKGLPFSSIKLSDLRSNENILVGKLEVSTSDKRTINGLVIKGYEKFPKAYLKYFLKLQQGDNLDLESIKTKAATINSLPFASQTRPPEVLFSQDSSTVYLYLDKTQSNLFDGYLGFGTNENNNKLEFNGYLDLNLINTLNYGERFSLRYRSDGSDQKTFNAKVNLPYLFNTPIGSELALDIFKQDSTFTKVNQSADLFYQIDNKQRISFGIDHIKSNKLDNATLTNSIDDFNTNYVTVGYEYLSLQNFNLLFPSNQSLIINVGLGKRNLSNTKEKQSFFKLNTHKIFYLNNTNSVYLKLLAEGLNSKTYVANELLRFGGINSLRGFEENSFFANFYGILNTEYRYQLSPSLYIHTLFDAAYTENKVTTTKEKLYGFGFGFGILTKSGVLKFNFANGKQEDQSIKFNNSKVHLSLSTKF